MKAKLCDRCGRFYIPYKERYVIKSVNVEQSRYDDIDICTHCESKLIEFLLENKGKGGSIT